MTSTGRARELAEAFDRSFAEARKGAPEETEDILAVGVGGRAFAVRLDQVAALRRIGAPSWLPGPLQELCGLVSLRGVLLPVYDTAALLGAPSQAALRWMAVARDEAVGFAFESFDGHLRVPITAIAAAPDGQSRQVVATAEGPRAIIDLPALAAGIRERIAAAA